MKPFLLKTTLLSILLILAYYLLDNQLNHSFRVPLIELIVIFFFISTNIVHYLLFRLTERNMRKFNPAFLGFNMIKMMIYFLAALVYLWFNREYARDFLIALFIVYAAFSILEILEISRLVKRKK